METSAIRIVLVEDHLLTRVGLKTVIGRTQDIKVVGEADNGEQALDRVRELKPDVVLMDVGMPIMDGIEAASRIRPDDGNLLNALGVAQYREGHYDQALKTLTRSVQLNSKEDGQSNPTDIAFLAMSHHRLGHATQARQFLARLRQLLQQDRWKGASDEHRFLLEAEQLIAPK